MICILGYNSIAAVNNKGNVAKIRSFRDQSLLTFNGGYSTIESIGLFEEQPFIAVALANGNLDMYHTGNGAVLRHLQLPNKNSMMVVHPQKTIIVESDGHHILKTHYYFEKYSYDPQIRNYAPNMIQKRKESASLVKRGHSASNVTIKTYKCPLPHHAT